MNHEPASQPGADERGPVPAALAQLAQELDARRYPGRAWPAAQTRRTRRILWPLTLSAGAIAATMIVAVSLYRQAAPLPPQPHQGDPSIAARSAPPVKRVVAAGPGLPRILIVEDWDSYSLVDLSGQVPMVAFAWKDSTGFECVMPMAAASTDAAATRNTRF